MTGIPFATTALRLQLRKAGFHPLPVEGKVPHINEWQEKFLSTNDEQIRLWPKTYHLAYNTGILSKLRRVSTSTSRSNRRLKRSKC
jgi:hypothetical protein